MLSPCLDRRVMASMTCPFSSAIKCRATIFALIESIREELQETNDTPLNQRDSTAFPVVGNKKPSYETWLSPLFFFNFFSMRSRIKQKENLFCFCECRSCFLAGIQLFCRKALKRSKVRCFRVNRCRCWLRS